MRTLLALGVAAAMVVMVMVAREGIAAAQTGPVPATAATGNAAAGGAAYAKVGCATCHGPEGRGTAAAPSLAASTLPVAQFVAYVRRPTGIMPPHSPQVVSDAMLTDIHAFVHQRTAQAAAPASVAASAGRVDAGAKLYVSTGCYQCHSNQAQGGAQGPRLGPDPVPFARFSSYVRNPAGQMPPYTSVVLSDQDLADIYAWVEARPEPPALSSIPLLAP